MMATRLRDYQAYLLLLLFAVLAYWPMSLMLFSAKNDAIHYFLAMRYNTSEMIQYGLFPSWSPYINLGYPLHGDIQSGVWNPFVFLMSVLRHYDVYWLHTEIILINVLAGVGMYRILKSLALDGKISVAIAAAYMLNGYMTDAGQFLNWLYAGALLPFVALFALKVLQSFQWRDAFGLGASFALLLLCGYPADTILAGYLLLAAFIYSFIRKAKKWGTAKALKKHLGTGLFALFCFLAISLPALISFMEFFPQVKRGSGVSLDLALSNSLAPANLVSFLYPWVTLKGDIFSGTDPLIRNCFIGLTAFSFFLLFFLQRRRMEPWQKFLAWAALFFFVFSLGKHTPLRSLAYQFVPLMDSFRHPANAKLFFMFIAQVLAAVALDRYFPEENRDRKKLRSLLLVMVIISSVAFLVALAKSQAFTLIGNLLQGGFSKMGDALKMARDSLSTMDLLLLNVTVALVILTGTLLLMKKGLFRKYLLPLVFVEMFVAAQLMLPLTYVRNYRPAEVKRLMDAQPGGYPVPDLETSIAENSADGMSTFEKIGCFNIYNKKVGRVDYIITPSNLSRQDDFWENTAFREQVLQNPLLYYSEKLVPDSASQQMVTRSPMDSAGIIRIRSFSPVKLQIETEFSKPGYLIFLQNYYPRWTATVDKSPAPVQIVNETFMAVAVPAGKNQIVFSYKSADLAWMGAFSLAFLLGGIILCSRRRKHITLEP